MVAATLAALSGESTVHPPGVTQGNGVITGALGGSQGCSWRGDVGTGKIYGGFFEVLGCSGSLTSLHRPQTCLAWTSHYCLPSIQKVFLHGQGISQLS